MRWLGLVLIFGSQPAFAKVLDIYAQAEGGGASGRGVAGAQKDNAFAEHAEGGAYGLLAGVELFFVDAWVEHLQFRTGDGLVGTWTQLMAGLDMDLALGDDPPEGQKPKTFFELGGAVGFGMGTGSQVEPPLDNGEISDKGFITQLRAGIDHHLGDMLSIGASVPVTYGYLFKNDVANDESNHYQQVSVALLVHLRLHLDLGD